MFSDPLISALAGSALIVILFVGLMMLSKDDKEEKTNIKTYIKLFVISFIAIFFVFYNYTGTGISKVLEESVETGLAPF